MKNLSFDHKDIETGSPAKRVFQIQISMKMGPSVEDGPILREILRKIIT